MPPIPPLESFGGRIMICGPSNSGKSTLATAIGSATGLPVVHLDRLRFVPHTNWVDRPADDFAHDVAEAASAESWIIEGNYFTWIAPRLARATGIILLNDTRIRNYARYLRRSLFDRSRAGRLDGASEPINWKMTRWILWDEPRRRGPKLDLLRAAGLPVLEIHGMSELSRLYAAWGLAHG